MKRAKFIYFAAVLSVIVSTLTLYRWATNRGSGT